jgi:hypothetical protein
MANDEFVAWWLQTEFGSRIKRNIFEGRRQAECWKHFHQVAAIKDGAPKVLCKSCDHALHHPGDGHRGTSTMNKHYSSSVNCRKMTSQSNDIRKLIRQGVSIPSIFFFSLIFLPRSFTIGPSCTTESHPNKRGLAREGAYLHN